MLTGLLAYRGITTQKLAPVATSVSCARQPIAWLPELKLQYKPVVDAVREAIPVTSKISKLSNIVPKEARHKLDAYLRLNCCRNPVLKTIF